MNHGVKTNVNEASEVLKSMEKWLMALQDASESYKYFKPRIIDLLVFANLENLSNLNQILNLIDIDPKW